MSLVDQLEKSKAAEEADTKRAYREIVAREAEGKTKPTDAALLAELLRSTNRTTADFSRDARALGDLAQAKKNRDLAAGDPTRNKIEFDQANEALNEARERFELAKSQLLAAQQRFDAAWGLPQRVALADDGVRRAEETCRQLGLMD